jgi:hypothetical protein
MLKIPRLHLKETGFSLEHVFQPSTLKELCLPPTYGVNHENHI